MFVSVTRLRLRSWRYVPAFMLYTRRAARQAKKAEGNLSVALQANRHLVFWTLTGWTDRQSMLRYRNNAAHGKAMPRLKVWCDEASYAHWEQSDDAAATWEEARRRLVVEGKLSHVRHPSPAQQEGRTAPDH